MLVGLPVSPRLLNNNMQVSRIQTLLLYCLVVAWSLALFVISSPALSEQHKVLYMNNSRSSTKPISCSYPHSIKLQQCNQAMVNRKNHTEEKTSCRGRLMRLNENIIMNGYHSAIFRVNRGGDGGGVSGGDNDETVQINDHNVIILSNMKEEDTPNDTIKDDETYQHPQKNKQSFLQRIEKQRNTENVESSSSQDVESASTLPSSSMSKEETNKQQQSKENVAFVSSTASSSSSSPLLTTASAETTIKVSESEQNIPSDRSKADDKPLTSPTAKKDIHSSIPSTNVDEETSNSVGVDRKEPLDSSYSSDLKHKISSSFTNTANGFNQRVQFAKSAIHQRTMNTRTKFNSIHCKTKQSMKSYMDTIKTKEFKLERNDDISRTINNNLRNSKLKVTQMMQSLGIKSKNGSILLSQLIMGTGITIRHDVIIWSVAFILSLLGTSLGFHSFLYFVTVGFGVSIGLMAITSLIVFNSLSSQSIPLLTNLHTMLVILWSVRLTSFLLHREFINWKEWHAKLKEMNNRANSSKAESAKKISIWLTCATCYSCMIMPCVYRLKASLSSAVESVSSSSKISTTVRDWGIVGKVGIILQCIGLLLESIADAQKANFKRVKGNRYLWCNTGLWNFSTHPNYLGEVLFWVGTYLGGISCCNTIMQYTLCTVGLIFILIVMKGAIDSLSSKHMKKWGHYNEWLEFKRTHSIMGPIRVSTENMQALPIYR